MLMLITRKPKQRTKDTSREWLSERLTYLFPLIQDRQCSDPRQSNSHLFRATRNNLHFKASAEWNWKVSRATYEISNSITRDLNVILLVTDERKNKQVIAAFAVEINMHGTGRSSNRRPFFPTFEFIEPWVKSLCGNCKALGKESKREIKAYWRCNIPGFIT